VTLNKQKLDIAERKKVVTDLQIMEYYERKNVIISMYWFFNGGEKWNMINKIFYAEWEDVILNKPKRVY
jgi:hypothetical protein